MRTSSCLSAGFGGSLDIAADTSNPGSPGLTARAVAGPRLAESNLPIRIVPKRRRGTLTRGPGQIYECSWLAAFAGLWTGPARPHGAVGLMRPVTGPPWRE